MLELLIVAYAQFMTKVEIQQSLYWSIADWRGFQEVEASRFPDIWHMKVVWLSAPHTFHLNPLGNIPGLIPFRGRFDPRAIVQPAKLYQ
jgi:hypothetical protein